MADSTISETAKARRLCDCIDAVSWEIIQSALLEEIEELDKLRKRVDKSFQDVVGVDNEKKAILNQINVMDKIVIGTLHNLEKTPKCKEVEKTKTG